MTILGATVTRRRYLWSWCWCSVSSTLYIGQHLFWFWGQNKQNIFHAVSMSRFWSASNIQHLAHTSLTGNGNRACSTVTRAQSEDRRVSGLNDTWLPVLLSGFSCSARSRYQYKESKYLRGLFICIQPHLLHGQKKKGREDRRSERTDKKRDT